MWMKFIIRWVNKRIVFLSKSMHRKGLLFGLSILIFCLLFSACIGQFGVRRDKIPFFAYLKNRKVAPALVAFNCTSFDPRTTSNKIDDSGLAALSQDLLALKGAFNGLVLYEYQEDWTPIILKEAYNQGFKAVLLGVWDPKSQEEIAGVANIIKEYANKLALAVIIGNEGITNNRYTIKDLEVATSKLRAALPTGVRIPLTTSEPIGEYGLVLCTFGDFLAPNIHPFVDRGIIDPKEGAEWVRKRALRLSMDSRKSVLVKETGMPNGGDPRYTPETQKAFWKAYLDRGRLVEVDGGMGIWVSYAVGFEAYDLPWKAEKTGVAIEGRWGFFSYDRKPYPIMDVWYELRRQSKASKEEASLHPHR